MNTNNTRASYALMSRAEAARYLGISPRTLSRRIDEGSLPFVRTCKHGRVYFRKSDLDDFIKKHIYTGRRFDKGGSTT